MSNSKLNWDKKTDSSILITLNQYDKIFNQIHYKINEILQIIDQKNKIKDNFQIQNYKEITLPLFEQLLNTKNNLIEIIKNNLIEKKIKKVYQIFFYIKFLIKEILIFF